jgi:D-lactate dehydrogenase (cytochrome)
VIRTGQRARKSAAGYDLTRLFVGAEGTLGILTEITLKLHPQPQAISAAVCSFDTLHNAVDTAIAVIQSAIPVARIELVDDVMMRGINAYSKLSYQEAPTLFFEFHGSETAVDEQAEAAQAIAAEHGGRGFEWAKAAEDRSRLWHARDNTLYAGVGLRPGARAVITDVCVPISRLAECLTKTRQDADDHGFVAPIVGHVGDGNFHMLILIDPANADEIAGAKTLHARMVARAIAMDGTCTGEHGIGLGKIGYLVDELGEAVDVMRSIKTALDPHGLMNPGKIFAGARA